MMRKIIVRPGKTVRGVTYYEATKLDVSKYFAAYLVNHGIADYAE